MDERERHSRTLRRVQLTGHVVSTVVECVAVAEIVWYYLHDGEQTLHEAAAEYWQEMRAWWQERARVRHTRDMIRDLPEKE